MLRFQCSQPSFHRPLRLRSWPQTRQPHTAPWVTSSLSIGLLLSLLLSGCGGTNKDLEAQVLQIIRDNPDVVIESVQAYQVERQAAEQQAQTETAARLLADRKTVIGDSPATGAEQGDVLLLEFSDFECPFCANVNPVIKEFMEKHGDRVTLVYKHFPLIQLHKQAVPAALASWAAQQQGKFWEYHDALFANQERLGEELYLEIAQELDLDLDQFQTDIASEAASQAIQTDLQLVAELGLSGTPTFFLNGTQLSGALSIEALEAELATIKTDE